MKFCWIGGTWKSCRSSQQDILTGKKLKEKSNYNIYIYTEEQAQITGQADTLFLKAHRGGIRIS